MTRRLYQGPDSLVISRAGYDAYPGMPEVGKAFDSSWPFTGIILGSGLYADPSPIFISNSDAAHPTFTTWSSPISLSLTQPLASGYGNLFLLAMEYYGTARQGTTALQCFYETAYSVQVPRIVTNRRFGGVNRPAQTAYSRFQYTIKFLLLGG